MTDGSTRPRARPIVAIDGPAGSGKSTVAKQLALALGFDYIDTGAMYRAFGLTLAATEDPEDSLSRAGQVASEVSISTHWDREQRQFCVTIDGRDLTHDVRSPRASEWASRVAAVAAVREVLVAMQRRLGADGGVVMEGRDIGTVVFPDAEFKFFLDADPVERVRRRGVDEGRSHADVGRELLARDARDSSRPVAPLAAAGDAVCVDTTELRPEQVVEQLLVRIRS